MYHFSLLALLSLAACAAAPDPQVEEEVEGQVEEEEGLIGGCVQPRPVAEIPRDVRAVGPIQQGEGPFPKRLSAYGIVLAAEPEVPDVFLERVARSIAETFGAGEGIDADLQEQVIGHLHAYGALLPVPRTERSFERALRRHEDLFDQLVQEHSVCDIIMARVERGQVMEVVEHVLHTITDVALHHQFPDEWGLHPQSALSRAMQRAIDAGFYDISGYDDLGDAPDEVVHRVLVQEFAYWFLTTAWDLQVDYGPDEEEWTLRRPEELRAALPEFFAVHERTSARVLTSPSRETLALIGPTRAEER